MLFPNFLFLNYKGIKSITSSEDKLENVSPLRKLIFSPFIFFLFNNINFAIIYWQFKCTNFVINNLQIVSLPSAILLRSWYLIGETVLLTATWGEINVHNYINKMILERHIWKEKEGKASSRYCYREVNSFNGINGDECLRILGAQQQQAALENFIRKRSVFWANRIHENSEEPLQVNGKVKKKIREQGTWLKLCFRAL